MRPTSYRMSSLGEYGRDRDHLDDISESTRKHCNHISDDVSQLVSYDDDGDKLDRIVPGTTLESRDDPQACPRNC
jgi:hypothetical protein